MASRWLGLRWAPGFFCVPLIMETVSAARDSSTKTLEHIQFAARGVNQTAMADVSTWAGQEGRLGGVSAVLPANYYTSAMCQHGRSWTLGPTGTPDGTGCEAGGQIKSSELCRQEHCGEDVSVGSYFRFLVCNKPVL